MADDKKGGGGGHSHVSVNLIAVCVAIVAVSVAMVSIFGSKGSSAPPSSVRYSPPAWGHEVPTPTGQSYRTLRERQPDATPPPGFIITGRD